MGACRGKRCIRRLKTALIPMGIQIVGDATPRGPLSNQVSMGELYPKDVAETYITGINGKPVRIEKVQTLVAGGGIGGSALFRYMAEAGLNPVLINFGRGASWRNIAGGRTAFSLPEISQIAASNHQIFKELHSISNIDYRPMYKLRSRRRNLSGVGRFLTPGAMPTWWNLRILSRDIALSTITQLIRQH